MLDGGPHRSAEQLLRERLRRRLDQRPVLADLAVVEAHHAVEVQRAAPLIFGDFDVGHAYAAAQLTL